MRKLLVNENGNWQHNIEDDTWSVAVPMPFYGLRKKCTTCGKGFWKEENYYKHFVRQHTDGKRYKRTPKGLIEL